MYSVLIIDSLDEHLKSETAYGVKLTQLSKRLEIESRKANVRSCS